MVSIAHEEDIYGKNTDQKERLDRASIVSFFKKFNQESNQEIYSGSLGETILLLDLSMARIVARILYYRFVCFRFRLQIQSCGR